MSSVEKGLVFKDEETEEKGARNINELSSSMEYLRTSVVKDE